LSRTHRREPVTANIVVYVRFYLLVDHVLSRRPIARPGHRGGGGQPRRPLRQGAVIDADDRRDLRVDQVPQVVPQRLAPLGRRADFGNHRVGGVAMTLQEGNR
jgi:hypothetical protein